MKASFAGPLEKVDDCCYRIPKGYRSDMRVDGLIFASDKLMESIRADMAPEQVANVATLPGIQGASLAMPDIHWGYGFCIGGVCATDPGGRRRHLPRRRRVRHQLRRAARAKPISSSTTSSTTSANSSRTSSTPSPPAWGKARASTSSTPSRPADLMGRRAEASSLIAASECPEDLLHTEANGKHRRRRPARGQRSRRQTRLLPMWNFGQRQPLHGSSGRRCQIIDGGRGKSVRSRIESGLRDDSLAARRGLGYQVCDDALAQPSATCPSQIRHHAAGPAVGVRTRPIRGKESKYISAMRAAANFGFCNRQLAHAAGPRSLRDDRVRPKRGRTSKWNLLYDVAHNIAKLEEHTVEGKTKQVWVHRKGATRAFPAGHPEVPVAFQQTVGQPVIIPGDMGRAELGAGWRARVAWSAPLAPPATVPAAP